MLHVRRQRSPREDPKDSDGMAVGSNGTYILYPKNSGVKSCDAVASVSFLYSSPCGINMASGLCESRGFDPLQD